MYQYYFLFNGSYVLGIYIWLKITAGQQTMTGLNVGLTGQTLVWPVIFGCLLLNAFCSITL